MSRRIGPPPPVYNPPSEEPAVVWEGKEYLVVNKPAGLLSVPGRGPDKQDCLVSRLRKREPALPVYPAVHRLDMATSGLLLLARNKEALSRACGLMEERRFGKEYTALLEGSLPDAETHQADKGFRGRIELSFRLDPENRPRQIYDPIHGKRGITLWEYRGETPHPEDTRSRVSRILFIPLTGRTHQLRLHAAHPRGLGIPLSGDPLYGQGPGEGNSPPRRRRLYLHASRLILPPELFGYPSREAEKARVIDLPAPF